MRKLIRDVSDMLLQVILSYLSYKKSV